MFTRSDRSIHGARTGALIALLLLGRGAAAAIDPPPQELDLKKHGLEKAGDYFLIAADKEAHAKIDEALRAEKAWRKAVVRLANTPSVQDYQAYLKQMNDQVAQYRNQINAVNRQINAAGRGVRRGYTNSAAAEAKAEMTMGRNQLQYEMNQLAQSAAQLKANPVKPQDKERAAGEVRDLRDAYEKAVKDARETVDAATKKYEELSGDADVKKLLEKLGTGLKMKPKLGPSRGFTTNVKLLEKMERELGEPAPAPAAQAKHKKTGTKKSLKAARGLAQPSETAATKP